MNQYLKYNKEVVADFERREKKHPIMDKAFWGYQLAKTFKCNICGGWLSSETVWYYQGIPERFKCYECQEKEILMKGGKNDTF